MTDAERLAGLRHALNNPLAALLAETQLLLLGDSTVDDETRHGLQEIEKLALRMRAVLRDAQTAGAPPVS
ncbi:MAG TPA: histidine kinase dimerization/phospho-acceptor domain-containing protein [Gemmatimonadales bacterium]|jgi:signal transduction histidine kinase